MSGGGMPELGSKISLISKADIRYEGRLFTVDPQECTIALANVRSFGTEDRETQYPIAPQSQIYDYILFRGTDIKDIRVVNNSMPHPNDPAIMQMQLPNGQHLMPHFPMPAMNPPMGNYVNPFGALNNIGGIGGNAGMAPNSFMLNNNKPKQQSELNDAIPETSNINSTTGPSTVSTTNTSSAAEHKDQENIIDLISGNSRSTTPVSLRKSPSTDMGVQLNQNAGHNRDVGHKRQNNQQNQRGSGGNQMQSHNQHHQSHFQRDRQDSGRMDQHDNRNHNNQRNNQNQLQNNRGWMNRGGGGGGGGGGNNMNHMNNMMRNNNRGRGGSGRIQNQSYFPQGGYRQQNNGNVNKGGRPPKNTIKFEQDYDFEQANNKFEEMRTKLAKLKVGEVGDAKTASTEQVNGETDTKKDDSGNETGAGEHEQEDEDVTVGYDKAKSFFDNISCEAATDRSKNKKNDWRQERKLNSETFGISLARRGNYRGRGGYYNRNMNHNNGYNRGYRPNNFNNNRGRNNNNRIGQSTGLPAKNPNQQQQQPSSQSEPQQAVAVENN